MQVSGEELQELQCLHESTYRLAQRFCEHGDLTSRHILMQHGPLPEKEEDIQVMLRGKGCTKRASEAALPALTTLLPYSGSPRTNRTNQVFHPCYSISHSDSWQALSCKTA